MHTTAESHNTNLQTNSIRLFYLLSTKSYLLLCYILHYYLRSSCYMHHHMKSKCFTSMAGHPEDCTLRHLVFRLHITCWQ